MQTFLIFAKASIGADVLSYADADGNVITGGQDVAPGERLGPDLIARANASPEQAYVLYDEPAGVTVRALSIVRDDANAVVLGYVMVGTVLDVTFLQAIQASSDSQLAILWRGQARAATIGIGSDEIAQFPTSADVDASPTDLLSRTIKVSGANYYGIFTLERTHTANADPLLLGVLVAAAPVEDAQRSLFVILGAVLIGVIAAVVVLSYRSARTITAPLEHLAAAAQQIEAGDLGVRIDARSPYEVGTLERAFDTMARSLQERDRAQQEYLDEVRTVNAVSDAVVGVTDRERIFAESLSRLVSLVKADAAAIVLREGMAGGLVSASTANIEPDTATSIATDVLSGKTGDPDVVQRSDMPYGVLRSAAHVPLSTRGLITGLLSIVLQRQLRSPSRGPDPPHRRSARFRRERERRPRRRAASEQPAARTREPAQERVPRVGEPRAPHADERDHRLHEADARRPRRRDDGAAADGPLPRGAGRRQPARSHQRPPRPREDRSGQDGAQHRRG